MAREPTRSTEIFATLCTALDDVEIGIALLDKELRLQFINRTFPRLWRVANDEVVDAPDFESLMRIVAHRLSPMPQAEADKIVSERIRLVRAGLEGPRDVRLADGQVIRVRCKPLPNGGRMLIYSDVTDLVEQADQLRQFATLDSLTGLFNRRHFLILAEIEWARYRRYQRPTSMLMIDVDRFKVINDGFGHDVGDHVLKGIADICSEQKRLSDVAARFGGDEFIILLSETRLADASVAAERLRQEVAKRELSEGSPIAHATLSVGVAEATPDMSSLFDLIKRADQAVYAAKNLGRNRVCVWDSDSVSLP